MNEVISIPVQNTVNSAPVQSSGLPFKIVTSSYQKPNAETREATKNTLDRINKGYGSVLSVFKRNAAFKRSDEATATTSEPAKKEQTKRNLIPNTNSFLSAPSMSWGKKRGFWSAKSNWFKNSEKTSNKPTFLVGKIPVIKNSVAKIPLIKRASMVENENMSKHAKRDSNYDRSDYMPLFKKRYAFEAGGNHGYGDGSEEIYKRLWNGRNQNLIQLATSMSQKRSGSWRQDPRAGLLLMKGLSGQDLQNNDIAVMV